MMRAVLLGVMLFALTMAAPSLSSSAFATTLRCNVDTKNWCSAAGCNQGPGDGEYVIINTDNQTYSLCKIGKDDCDVLVLNSGRQSGAFMMFDFGGASFLKMALMDVDPMNIKEGEFIEVRDSMVGAMNSFGSCETLR